MASYQVRQGDCFLERVGELPKGAKALPRDSRGRIVILEGEATGHAHAILEPNAVLYEAAGVVERYLQVTGGPVVLRHEEHGIITLEPGVYVQRPQWEYDEAEERRVAD